MDFCYFFCFSIRISGGEPGFPEQISDGILELIGIGVVTPIIGNALSRFKYDSTISRKRIKEIPALTTMLLENDKPVLFRYQMFLWTFVGIGIYLFVFFSTMSMVISDVQKAGELGCDQLEEVEAQQKGCTNLKQLNSLNLPDIDPSLVILMGLSQGGYFGGKLVARPPARINRLIVGTTDDKSLTIMGEGFDSGGIILVGRDKVATGPTPEVKWEETRIDVPKPVGDKITKGTLIEIITNESVSIRTIIDDENTNL